MKVSRKLYAHLYRLTRDLKWGITHCLTNERRVERSSHVWVQEKLERARYRGGLLDVLRLNVFIESKEIEWTSIFHFFRHVTPQISSWLQTFLTFLNHEIFAKHTTHKWNAKYIHTDDCKYKLHLRTGTARRWILPSLSEVHSSLFTNDH